MFWRLGFAQTSPIETLLESDDFTLQQLLDEDDVVQECKQLNNKLIDFLAQPQQVEALVNYIVAEPDTDATDKLKFIYPYKSSEILSADVPSIQDCLLSRDELLDKLFSILKADEGKLNVMLAGFFSKVMTSMMNYRPEDVLAAMHARSALPLLLRHINTYSILELLLKVVQEAEEASGAGPEAEPTWCDWLIRQDMVPQILAKFGDAFSAQVHENASSALVSILSHHGQTHSMQPRRAPLAKRLLEPQMVATLLDQCLASQGSAVEHAVAVLVELAKVACKQLKDSNAGPVAPRTPDGQGAGSEGDDASGGGEKGRRQSAVDNDTALGKIVERLQDLVGLLHSPPPMAVIINSTGKLDPPLGVVRLMVLELIGMLIALENPRVDARLAELHVLPVVLDLFFKYAWHNLLHNLVRKMLEPVITASSAEAPTNEALKRSLLDEGKLLTRIIEAHADNDEHVRQPKAARKGYMGQLRVLSLALIKSAQSDSVVRKHTNRGEWQDFVNAHPDLREDLNDSKMAASPSHSLSSPSRDQDFDMLEKGLNSDTYTEEDGDAGDADATEAMSVTPEGASLSARDTTEDQQGEPEWLKGISVEEYTAWLKSINLQEYVGDTDALTSEGQGGCGNPAAMLDKKRVAAWLKSINFDEYAARIIDYGYDSMKAVFLADEADVHAMTEDAKIAMKKPHRTVFLKEWQALRKTGKTPSSPNKATSLQTSPKSPAKPPQEVAGAADALSRVVARVAISLRMQDGRPIASAQFSLITEGVAMGWA